MKTAIIRWTIFLLIGLPFQFVVMAIYPLLHLYWKLFIHKKVDQTTPVHDFTIPASEGNKTRVDGLLLDNVDDHGAFSMYGFVKAAGLGKLVDKNYNLVRRYEDNGVPNQNWVSGDVVIAFAFASILLGRDHQPPVLIEKVADQYLKNLGVQSFDSSGNNGDVSNRCNNFGINYCPDSEAWGIGQPMAGPQFYTNAAIFALASQYSKFYKVVFWTHWVLLGGWYWAFSPMIHTKDRRLAYVRDMTMKALYVQLQVFGPRWWIIKPMEKITKEINSCRNDLHYAMLGEAPQDLPVCMDSFFSQMEDGGSHYSDRMSSYIPDAVRKISQQSRAKE